MTITIKELQKQVHNLAIEKGWWPMTQFGLSEEDTGVTFENPRINLQSVNIPEKLMLMVSELGEALEFYRDDIGMEAAVYLVSEIPRYYTNKEIHNDESGNLEALASTKPDGFWIELADTIIRILDLAGAYNIDMEDLIKLKHEYNKTRPYRHGGKKC